MFTPLVAFVLADTSSGSPPAIVYILGAILAGGLLPLIYQALQRWRAGPLQDSALISHTIAEQLGGMKELLDEYRVEIEVAKRQLEDYRTQLGDITKELAKAQVRIGQLEDQLDRARDERSTIERDLERLRAQYEQLRAERHELEEVTSGLRDRLRGLELIAGQHPDDPPPAS